MAKLRDLPLAWKIGMALATGLIVFGALSLLSLSAVWRGATGWEHSAVIVLVAVVAVRLSYKGAATAYSIVRRRRLAEPRP